MNERIALSLLGSLICLSAAGVLASTGKWWWAALCFTGWVGCAWAGITTPNPPSDFQPPVESQRNCCTDRPSPNPTNRSSSS